MSNGRSRSPLRQNDEEYHELFMANLPDAWDNYRVIKSFIEETMRAKIISEMHLLPNAHLLLNSLVYVSVKKNEQGKIVSCSPWFRNKEACKYAKTIFTGMDVFGKKLVVMQNSAMRAEEKKRSTNNVPNEPPLEESPVPETYGLSPQFLEALNIKPPLMSRIFVANLIGEIDESKLKNIFCLAGYIVSANILRTKDGKSKGCAKIEYDHPVEAVQAISMFHNQELYNRKLIVQFDTQPNPLLLPDGMSSIGPGLGPNGDPLRNVRNVLEIHPLKQLLSQELSKLVNAKAENAVNQSSTTATVPLMTNATDANTMLNQNLMTTMGQTAMIDPLNQLTLQQQLLQQFMQNSLDTNALQGQRQSSNVFQHNSLQSPNWTNASTQPSNVTGLSMANMTQLQTMPGVINQSVIGQGLPGLNNPGMGILGQNMPGLVNVGQSVMDMLGNVSGVQSPMANVQVHNNIRPRSRASSTSNRFDRRPAQEEEIRRPPSSDMLVFENLPSSVNLSALSSKMREVGELKFAELVGRGKAIVRFMRPEDADRCIKLFDNSKVDGQVIDVKYF